jgi:hypothetical protein
MDCSDDSTPWRREMDLRVSAVREKGLTELDMLAFLDL